MKTLRFQSLLLLSLLFLSTLTSCNPQARQSREIMMTQLREGDVDSALSTVDQRFQQRMKNKTDPLQCQDSPYLLLDRATIRWMKGDREGARRDYLEALRVLKYFDQESDPEKWAEVALGEMAGAYVAPPFEQVLARTYLALCLFDEGDTQNAYALLRQAEEWQQQEESKGTQPHLVINSLSKLLFTIALEKHGDKSNAAILRQQLREYLGEEASAAKLGDKPLSSKKSATVLIICHNGTVPFRTSVRCPESLLTSQAVEVLLAAQGVDPALSTQVGFEVPQMCSSSGSAPRSVQVSVGGVHQSLVPCFNVEAVARAQLDHELPHLVSKAIIRHAMRRAAVAASKEANSEVGAMADLAVLMWNLGTHADDRCWASLPSRLDVARFDLQPGTHHLNLYVTEGGILPSHTLNLPKDSLCIINVFTLSPGHTIVHVPQNFLSTTHYGE